MIRLSWLISMGISLFGVILIEHFFTLKLNHQSTVNGNLGAVGLALILPFILLSLFITFRYFTDLSRKSKDNISRGIYIGFGFALLVVVTYFALDYKQSVYADLGGNTKDPNSIIYQFPILNEYTNNIYINFYTFLMIHTVAALVGSFFGIFYKKKQLPEQSVSPEEDQ